MKVHLCMDVRNFLKRSEFPKGFERLFKHRDGRSMSPDEARDALFDELSKGHDFIPLGECDNFDYKSGCQGHEESEINP